MGGGSSAPDADAAARDFLGLKYGRVPADAIEISCGKALGGLQDKLAGMGLLGSGSRSITLLPEGALRRLEHGPGPGNKLLPDSFLTQARRILGLGRWIDLQELRRRSSRTPPR